MALHEITRVRRETRRRTLTVSSVERLTPRMLRAHFTSGDLEGFDSASPDDHIKLFFPGGEAGAKPLARDFTPRAFDAKGGTLTIDFAMHEAGPSMQWASRAAPGVTLDIGGPRGSAIVPDDFDWYWLIGDETALPAIGRRVEELRAGVPVTTLAVVANADEAQTFKTRAAWTPLWALRAGSGLDDGALLLEKLAGMAFPPGDGFVWIAAEASAARSAREYIVGARGHPREWVKAAGYWKRGQSEVNERIED